MSLKMRTFFNLDSRLFQQNTLSRSCWETFPRKPKWLKRKLATKFCINTKPQPITLAKKEKTVINIFSLSISIICLMKINFANSVTFWCLSSDKRVVKKFAQISIINTRIIDLSWYFIIWYSILIIFMREA